MDNKPWYMRKTLWAGAMLVVTTALPQFGVPEPIIKGIQSVIVGLGLIFLRESIEVNKPKQE